MSNKSAQVPIGHLVLTGLTIGLFMLTFWCIVFYAPVERQMGIVQKIFYFHVPSAYAMYLGFGLCAIGSIAYLVSRRPVWDAIAVSSAEVGLVFAVIVLITGPLWARSAWGTFWTWDPRLTTTLLAAMVFVSYTVLRSFGASGEAERRFAAGLAVVGLPIMFLIHYSVQRWRGQHPTVITSGGGGLAPEMLHTLLISFVFFTALTSLLIWSRVRAERAQQTLLELELQAAEQGLLEDT